MKTLSPYGRETEKIVFSNFSKREKKQSNFQINLPITFSFYLSPYSFQIYFTPILLAIYLAIVVGILSKVEEDLSKTSGQKY